MLPSAVTVEPYVSEWVSDLSVLQFYLPDLKTIDTIANTLSAYYPRELVQEDVDRAVKLFNLLKCVPEVVVVDELTYFWCGHRYSSMIQLDLEQIFPNNMVPNRNLDVNQYFGALFVSGTGILADASRLMTHYRKLIKEYAALTDEIGLSTIWSYIKPTAVTTDWLRPNWSGNHSVICLPAIAGNVPNVSFDRCGDERHSKLHVAYDPNDPMPAVVEAFGRDLLSGLKPTTFVDHPADADIQAEVDFALTELYGYSMTGRFAAKYIDCIGELFEAALKEFLSTADKSKDIVAVEHIERYNYTNRIEIHAPILKPKPRPSDYLSTQPIAVVRSWGVRSDPTERTDKFVITKITPKELK